MSHQESSTAQLAARLQVLEDDRALRDLLGRYAFYADSGQHEPWVQLFTEDGEVELIGGESSGTYGAHARWQGHDALGEFIDDPNVHMAIEGRCMHLVTANMRTHVDGDIGVVEAYYLVVLRIDGRNEVANCGITRLTCRRTQDGWRIRHRLRHLIGTDVEVLRTAHPELGDLSGPAR